MATGDRSRSPAARSCSSSPAAAATRPGTPKEGWDHSTPYLQRIFGEVFGMDVHLVEAELTLADVVPAMEALRGVARSADGATTDRCRESRERAPIRRRRRAQRGRTVAAEGIASASAACA